MQKQFSVIRYLMGSELVIPAQRAPNAGKSINRRYTNIWMNKDGKWRLTVRHANNVIPDASEKP